VKPAHDGMPGRHQGPRLLRAVSDSLAGQCPPPNVESDLIRLQAAARDRGLLGEGIALCAPMVTPEERQTESPHADLGVTVILAEPPATSLRRQWQPGRPVVSLAAATAVALIIVVAAFLGPRVYHRTFTPVRPPVASPTPSPPPVPSYLREIAGTWTGRISQTSSSGTFSVTIKLQVRPGSNRLRIFYSGSFTCSGYLLPLSADADQMVLNQPVMNGPCNRGTVTLTEQASRSLEFRFIGKGAPAATGTLTREKG
jgi:hypothetical protein